MPVMADTTDSLGKLAATSKRLVRRLLTIGENRLELLVVEALEERERLLHALVLALGAATAGLLAGVAFTALVVVVGWAWSPVGVLLALTGLYTAIGLALWRRLSVVFANRKPFADSLDQLKQDRACLEKLVE